MPVKESLKLVSHNRRCRQKTSTPGVVLECNEHGALLRIRRDDLGLFHGVAPGIAFHQLIDRDSQDKASDFLAEIKQQTSAYGWKLKVLLPGQPINLYVGGRLNDDLLLIFGTRTRGKLLDFSRSILEEDGAQEGPIPKTIAESGIINERELALQEQLIITQNKLANLQLVLSRKNAELRKVTAELRTARAGIRNLRSLLPICSSCKKIRDEQGDWHQVETYLRTHSGFQFTHSVCPDCLQSLYPGLQVKT